MTTPPINYPVELLHDGKGVYGIGVTKEAEIDPEPKDLDPPRPLVRKRSVLSRGPAIDYRRFSAWHVHAHVGRALPTSDPSRNATPNGTWVAPLRGFFGPSVVVTGS
jgi:hypothetical protein